MTTTTKNDSAKFDDVGFEPIPKEGNRNKHFVTFSQEAEGFAVIGIFKGIGEGKFGIEATVTDKDGIDKIFVLTAGLGDLRDEEKVPVGTMVKIVHLGLKDTKAGKKFRAFQIFVKK